MKTVFLKTITITALLGFLIPAFTFAQTPSRPHQFFGTVNFTNGVAPNGLSVEARITGTVVGSSVTANGKYGYNPNLLFVTDNQNTNAGKTIEFYVSGIKANETAIFVNGASTNLNLTVPGTIGSITKNESSPAPTPIGGGGGGGGGGGSSSVVAPTNASIFINSGAAKTNSRSVTLILGATNATQMVISNTADFVGIGWETFATGKTWNLTEGDGTKTVYAKFRSSSGGVSDIVSDTIIYEAAAIISPQQPDVSQPGQVLGAETFNFGLNSLVMVKNSPDVYAIMNGVKRKIRSAEIFNSYSEWWAKLKIKTVTQAYLNSLPEATLIKTSDSPNVYILSKGFKRLLASVEIFNSYGLDWNKIVTISQTEMGSYSVAPLIKHGVDLFWLDGSRVKHLFPSMESLDRNGYNTRDAIDVNDLEFGSFAGGIPISN